ncbi:alpha-1,2-fucosyltransferase [Mucilaginibacter sp. UYCu711]|uniref:alpha-1,2-fucosyltransferase n=1 Tax=Mucilaginibacter sp. UYCu711 TaxID=3156339 RepID=UPI003D22E83F
MIAVRLEGRLGNQLFQLAFVYTAAKKMGTSFYIDKSIENFLPAKYFEVKNDFLLPLDRFLFSIEGFKNIFRIHAKKAFYKTLHRLLLNNEVVEFKNDRSAYVQLQQIKDGCLYEGYFQSEVYFEMCTEDIRRLFTVKQNHKNPFDQLLTKLPASKKIVIHIRRGDYLDANLSLPLSYYKKALTDVYHKNTYCIFVSDDPQYVEQEFAYIENKYISKNSEIVDLQFLMCADICILSNSSFSWWGAWLNTKQDKKVYAPKDWLGFGTGKEYPVDVSSNLNVNWVSL